MRKRHTRAAAAAAAALTVTGLTALTAPPASAATVDERQYYCNQLSSEGYRFNVYSSSSDCINYLLSLNEFLPGGKLYELYVNQDVPAVGTFDRNFMFWAPQTTTESPSVKNTQWAYCAEPHALGTVCPADKITLVNAPTPGDKISGPVHVRVAVNGVFIGMFCGNASSFSGIAAGPVPTISGTKYEDVNGDGQRNPGEPGLGGVVIKLAVDGRPVAETTTDGAGNYAFALDANVNPAVLPGTYTMTEVVPGGWVQSQAPAPVNIGLGEGGTAVDDGTVVKAVNRTFAGHDFGNYRPASLSGSKVEDQLADGSPAGDPGLAGWTITARRNGAVAATTTTGPDGSYRFDGLRPGFYTIAETQQSGWQQSYPAGGIHELFLPSGQQETGRDFANWRPVTITGSKVEDLDADDSPVGDPGLAGWTISATRDGGGGAGSTQTGADGGYRLTDLRPGTYTISETPQPGWFQSFPATGTHTRTIRSGETAADVTFANWRPATLSGRKYQDLAIDGVGTGDPGKAGWSIQLSGTTTPGPVEPIWRVTGGDGGYLYEGLRPGQYTVAETQQAGWRQSAPNTGTAQLRLRSGQVVGAVDFGNVCLGGSDITVRDISTSTVRTGTTIRIEQLSVPGILSNAPALPWTTTTQAFTDLLPGTYRVIVFLDPDVYTTDPDVQVVDGRWAIVKTIAIQQCTRTPLTVEVFTRSHGKVTGGMKGTVDVGVGTSGFVFMTRGDVAEGHLEYNDHIVPFQLNTSDIRAIWVNDSATQAWVWGFVDYQGQRMQFELVLYDNGEPGSNDRYILRVLDAYSIGQGRTIIGGNIQIHD